ncbi:MAG: alpha/beta hydrolase [Anaerovoracaceae bacterium]
MKCHVNNINLFYEKRGKGKPLILLHGNGGTHKTFSRAIPILEKYFTVYAIDSRGHGNSQHVTEYHYEDMAEDIKCFINEKKLEKPILYGFSDGGIVGLIVASKYPKLLSQLIVSGANTIPGGLKDGWLKWFEIMKTITKSAKAKMVHEEPNITEEMLQKIEVPTVVLAGSRDMIKHTHTKKIAANIKNSSLRILHGEGHGSYIVSSRKIAELILELTGKIKSHTKMGKA